MAKKRKFGPWALREIPPINLIDYRSLSITSICQSMRWLALSLEKSRTIAVRLISMAMTGFFRTMVRPRASRPLSMLKYDPVVKKKVLFLEQKRGGKWSPLNGFKSKVWMSSTTQPWLLMLGVCNEWGLRPVLRRKHKIDTAMVLGLVIELPYAGNEKRARF
jgi:large subunit ribosomal protein L33